MRRWRAGWTIVFGLFVLSGVATFLVAPLRWRAGLVGLKATGRLRDLGWRELVHMVLPGGPVNLRPLLVTRNPYQSILLPDTSATASAAGAELFGRHCTSCHG